MTIRVVARIRPAQQNELEKDIIVKAASNDEGPPTLVKIPNPKSQHEDFTFQFSSVYDETAQQQTIFDNEGALNKPQARVVANLPQLHQRSSTSSMALISPYSPMALQAQVRRCSLVFVHALLTTI